MKKVIFTALIVLLALLAVTCDLLPPEQAAQLTADEPGFVTLTIGTTGDRARALDSTQAKAVVESADGFFEVVFYKYDPVPTNIITVRYNIDYTVWDTSGTWLVRVPIADYPTTIGSTSSVAVLFAGRKSDKTLLAVGLLTTAANLTSAIPTELTFKLEPIASELSSTLASSAFKIVSGSDLNIVSKTGTFDTAPNDVTNPLAYQIEKNINAGSTITASYTFTNLLSGIAFIDDAYNGGQKVYAENVDAGVSVQILTQPANSGIITSTLPSLSVDFNFVFETPDEEGLTKINIEVPVFAFNKNYSPNYGKQEAVRWFIRGGLNNKKIDLGGVASATNDGGAILLELVDPKFVSLPISSATGL